MSTSAKRLAPLTVARPRPAAEARQLCDPPPEERALGAEAVDLLERAGAEQPRAGTKRRLLAPPEVREATGDRACVAADGDRAVRGQPAEQRTPVEAPRRPDVQCVHDRRDDVHGAREPADRPTGALAGQLDEERHEGEVGRVPARDQPARLAGCEARAVVAGEDDQRAVVEARRAQPLEHEAERSVGVPELEQIALVALLDQPAVAPPPRVLDARNAAHLVGIATPLREVLPRHVRQERMQERQRRPLRRTDPGREGAELAPAGASLLGLFVAAAEVRPRVGDRRQPTRQFLRQQHVRVDDRRVGDERLRARRADRLFGLRGRCAAADGPRTESRQRLEHVHAVAPAEEREQVPRVIRVHR